MLFFPLSSKQTQQVFISPNNKNKIGTLENPGPWASWGPSNFEWCWAQGQQKLDLPLHCSSGNCWKGAETWCSPSQQDALFLTLKMTLTEKKIIQRSIFTQTTNSRNPLPWNFVLWATLSGTNLGHATAPSQSTSSGGSHTEMKWTGIRGNVYGCARKIIRKIWGHQSLFRRKRV